MGCPRSAAGGEARNMAVSAGEINRLRSVLGGDLRAQVAQFFFFDAVLLSMSMRNVSLGVLKINLALARCQRQLLRRRSAYSCETRSARRPNPVTIVMVNMDRLSSEQPWKGLCSLRADAWHGRPSTSMIVLARRKAPRDKFPSASAVIRAICFHFALGQDVSG